MIRQLIGGGLVAALAVGCSVEVETGGTTKEVKEESGTTSSTGGGEETAPPEVRYFLLER